MLKDNIIKVVVATYNRAANMAVLHLTVCFLLLSTGIEGVTIIVPSEKLIAVEFGQEMTLWCNFSYTSSENGDNRIEASLNLNDTNPQKIIYNYEQNGRNGGNDYVPALQNHFESRTDILELREPLAIGLKIQHAQWNDSGNYTWTMTVDRLRGSSQQNVHTNEVIVGRKPSSAFLHYTRIDDTTYKLVCNISGGKPTPTISILNDTNIIYTLVSDVSATVTLNITSKSVFYCTATNTLGSASSDPTVQLPESETTTATPPFTSTPNYSGVTQGPVSVSTETPDSSTIKDTKEEDTTPKPLEVHYIAIIAVSGCCVVVIVIIAVVCIHKHSAKKRQANPEKENTTGAGAENQHDEMPMDNSKYQQEQEAKQQRSAKGPRGKTKPAGGDGRKKRVANADPNAEETEQEQEEKQQRNVEGLQYADLDLRPTGKTKPAGGDGRNKLVFNDDSHVEYAEVRKV